MTRLDVTKTYKLYINGAFPRSESGRSFGVADTKGRPIAHMCRGSRKDLRDAVAAADKALGGWKKRTAYNRAQILYRMGEMLEGKKEEMAAAIKATSGLGIAQARKEVDHSIDRLVSYAGWADKFSQILGCNNSVAGPYYNFTVAEPTGVIGVIAPDEPSLLGLVSLVAPLLCASNTVVALGSTMNPIPTSVLGEVCATSDVPAGVLNLITGSRDELAVHLAMHRGVDGIHSANIEDDLATTLREGAMENVKRVRVHEIDDEEWADPDACANPWWIEPFVEMKTIWHPSAT
jgi:acyl-CoA reductase-like NAD-dependent aldehyde dehydrogenase